MPRDTNTAENIDVRMPRHVHDGEAAHRARAEEQQRDARDHRRDVRVEDRAPRALVARLDRRMRRRAPAQLLADALVDQHVGVDRHAERQRDGRDAGQRQRRLQHRQHRDQQQQVDRRARWSRSRPSARSTRR